MAEAFDVDVLLRHFEVLAKHTKDTPIVSFNAGLTEVSKLVKLLGSALGIAAKDIDEKVGILEEHLVTMEERGKTEGTAAAIPDAAADETKADEGGAGAGDAAAPGGAVRLTIQWHVLDEMARKVETSNNKKTYISGARSVLRMMWFLDFVHALIKNLVENPEDELRPCASKAYDVSLAPHHPWLLRKTVGAALYSLPYRAKFLESVCGSKPEKTAAAGLAALDQFNSFVGPLREALWAFYREHGIHELP